MLNLDTPVLVHALAGELTRPEETLLRDDAWSISTIVLWEIGKLAKLGRIEVDLEDAALGRTRARIRVWPLTLRCAARSVASTFGAIPPTRSSPPRVSCTRCRW